MSIKVLDKAKCESCINKKCSYVDARINESAWGLRTETTVCPKSVLEDGPLAVLKSDIISHKECIDCGLCVLNCYNNNLSINNSSIPWTFDKLTEVQENALACSYLNHIFDFCANTNRNKSLLFDGFMSTLTGESFFIEIDAGNDSLECTRGILGDILTYHTEKEMPNGIIVLKDLPKEGSNDVFDTVRKIKAFPYTYNLKIYAVTFAILREICLWPSKNCKREVSELMFDIENESVDDYLKRLSPNLINKIK